MWKDLTMLGPTWLLADLESLLADPMALIALGLVVWFGSMAMTGWIAGRKGRDDGNWAMLGLILGPVALLAVLVAPRKGPARS